MPDIGMPFVLILVSLIGFWSWLDLPLVPLAVAPDSLVSGWVPRAIPPILLMGLICDHTRVAPGLFRAAHLWLPGLPGSVPIASVPGCTGFAAATGRSRACCAALGKIAVPEMMHNRSNTKAGIIFRQPPIMPPVVESSGFSPLRFTVSRGHRCPAAVKPIVPSLMRGGAARDTWR